MRAAPARWQWPRRMMVSPSCMKLRSSPFVDSTGEIRGLIYDTETGELRDVEQSTTGTGG